MSKGNTFENDLLKMIFNNVGISGLTDNLDGSPDGSLYLSLHTADPGEGGDQTTNEVTYTDYARQAVQRDPAAWTVSGNQVTLASDVSFPECGVASPEDSETATYFAIGTDLSGTGKILYKGPITPNIAITTGVTPQLTTGTTVTED